MRPEDARVLRFTDADEPMCIDAEWDRLQQIFLIGEAMDAH
jgi:hypothetical protein